MKLFKTKNKTRDIYVWYNADLEKCVSGTKDEFELTKALSNKPEEFQMICLVGNDDQAIQNLTKNINQGTL
ncbi:MAG: hypothetical protein AAFQ94_27445 [Bacteroidota bacterium]